MEIQSNQIGNYLAGGYGDDIQSSQNQSNKTDNRQDSELDASDSANLTDLSQKNVVDITADQNKQSEFAKVESIVADNNTEADKEEIEAALEQVTEFVQVQNRQLNFSFDEQSNRSIIKVTDSDSGEIIRQIPSEDVLKLAERIKELQTDAGEAIGVLINRQV